MTRLNLLQKEWLETARSYKILFIPVVFILLGIGQPLAMHYMPQILKLGGLPEGAVIEIPVPPPAEILATIIDQYNQIGIFVLILAAMGVLVREVEQGQAGLLMTLGISRRRYLLTKWVVLTAITVLSTLVGFISTAYYTEMLFGSLDWGQVILAAIVYTLYPLFVVSLTLFFGTLFTSQLPVAGASLATVIVLSLAGAVKRVLVWLPNQVSGLAKDMLAGAQPALARGLVVSSIWIALTLVAAYFLFRRREL